MKMLHQREFYIVPGSVKVAHKHSSAVAYLSTSRAGRPEAKFFHGKAQKPSKYLWFFTEKAREAAVKSFFESVQQTEEHKAKIKAEAQAELAKPQPYKVGQIFVCSWGWEQTQVQAFEVIELVGQRSVKVREIACEREYTHSMQGYAKPIPGRFIKEAEVKKILRGGSIKIASYAFAYPMEEGRRYHFSEYA
jgi:hypothetical protein